MAPIARGARTVESGQGQCFLTDDSQDVLRARPIPPAPYRGFADGKRTFGCGWTYSECHSLHGKAFEANFGRGGGFFI